MFKSIRNIITIKYWGPLALFWGLGVWIFSAQGSLANNATNTCYITNAENDIIPSPLFPVLPEPAPTSQITSEQQDLPDDDKFSSLGDVFKGYRSSNILNSNSLQILSICNSHRLFTQSVPLFILFHSFKFHFF